MKKEWMYFIAGLALMAAVLSFSTSKDTSTDCVAVAKYLTKGKGNLIVTADDTASDFLLSREGADLTFSQKARQQMAKAQAELTPAQIAMQQMKETDAKGIPITAPKPAPVHQITVEEVDLTDHEKQLADYMKKRRTGHWEYVPAYVTCLKIEEGRI